MEIPMKLVWRCLLPLPFSFLLLQTVQPLDISSLDDSILFNIQWPGKITDDVLHGLDEKAETLAVTSSLNENYQCVIPAAGDKQEEYDGEYTGPNPLGLLQPLFSQVSCSYRLETYWTYEVCHGKFVRQYHQDDNPRSPTHEFYLGRWDEEKHKAAVEEMEKHLAEIGSNPLMTKKIDGQNLPFVAMNMTDGTICDLNGKPRFTRVLYVCYKQGKHEVYSLEETSTCEYEIVILSPYLCRHPKFRVKEQQNHDIRCYALDGSPARPRKIVQAEAENAKLKQQTTILELSSAGGGTYKVQISPVDISGITDIGAALLAEVDNERRTGRAAPIPPVDKEPVSTYAKPVFDAKLVEDFLKGDHCLSGGSGWWKYEFCYGKKVFQYHTEPDGSRTMITLGVFNEEKHRKWIEAHPSKRPTKAQVSHLYGDGSPCKETGEARRVEVRLKCRESSSPNSVSLYLLEPRTCEYVLGVESMILCPLIERADSHGVMSLPEEDFENAFGFDLSKSPADSKEVPPVGQESKSQESRSRDPVYVEQATQRTTVLPREKTHEEPIKSEKPSSEEKKQMGKPDL